jgi:hypothetical protein
MNDSKKQRKDEWMTRKRQQKDERNKTWKDDEKKTGKR